MLNFIPMLWPVPLVVGTYLAVVACEHLHRAPPTRTRLLLGVGMALALGLQWFVRAKVEQAAERYRALRRQTEALTQVGRQLEAMQMQGLAAPPDATEGVMGIDGVMRTRRTAPPDGASSLQTFAAPGGGLVAGPEQARQMAQQAQGMMQSIMPMLNDPKLTKGLPPEQARQIKQAMQMIMQMQGNMQSGKTMTPEERQQMMLQLMQLQQGLLQQQTPKRAPARKEKP